MQIIKVNIIEASSEIAIEIMKQKYKDAGWEDDKIDDILYEEDTLDSFKLREEYQDQFNNLYDIVYNVLENIQC
jgi:hypothetical protein